MCRGHKEFAVRARRTGRPPTTKRSLEACTGTTCCGRKPFPNRMVANHQKNQERRNGKKLVAAMSIGLTWGALASPGTLRGIARGTLLDLQQISHQLHRMTIFCVLRTWLWKYNTGDMLIMPMQAIDGDSHCQKQSAKAHAKIKAPKSCSLDGYSFTDLTLRRHTRA